MDEKGFAEYTNTLNNTRRKRDEVKGKLEIALKTIKEQKQEIKRLKEDGEKGYSILAEVREVLLPAVASKNNVCGDMLACTVTNPGCIKCLAEHIKNQLKEAHNRELSYIDDIETYQLQESLLLERLQKITLEYKELKRSSRTIRYFEMAEENLKMAQELALLKGEMSG